MGWLTWRQHRGEALATAVVVTLVVAVLVVTGTSLHHAFERDGAAACLGVASERGGDCDALVSGFLDRYQSQVNLIIPWLTMFPVLAGLFLGAPLLAREFEHGTWQLAWTQTVSRTRWLIVKVAALVALAVLSSLAVTVTYTWWRTPVTRVEGRFGPEGFNLEGVAPIAYTLFAFALGAAAALILRRTVPAIAATFAGFLLIRLPVEGWLRPRYRAPVRLVFDPIINPDANRFGTTGDWVLAKGFADTNGRPLTNAQIARVRAASAAEHLDIPTYLHTHGLQRWYQYQPARRFWTFQLLEAGIFVTAAVLLLAAVTVTIHRNPA